MTYLDPIEKIFKDLETTKEGLSTKEAANRLKYYGYNSLIVEVRFKIIKDFLAQFTNLLVIILVIAGILSIFFGEIRDAYIIFGIVILNALIGFLQEYKAERAIKALKKMVPQKAIVLRDKEEREINASELVPGDIVILDEGDNVPADIRLIETNNFFTNDAVLTGESEPQAKFAKETEKKDIPLSEIDNMVFMGTSVVSGDARGIVTATGMNTEFGKIAHITQVVKNVKSPLQVEIKGMARTISLITLVVVAIILGLGISMGKSFFESFGFSLGVAASTVPEGLAATISVALAVGVQRMAKAKSIIKKLNAAETLGATSIIITDKTGTLTKNEMTVKEIWANDKNIHVKGVGNIPVGEFTAEGGLYSQSKLSKVLEAAVLCNNAEIEKDPEKGLNVIGDSTEGALLVLGEKAGIDTEKFRKENRRIYEVPFDSERKMMSTINKLGDKHYCYTKGAPLEVLNKCSEILIDGKIKKITTKDKNEIKRQNDKFANEALRVLGLAYKEVSKKRYYKETEVERDLIFVGLVGIIDPPKPEAKEAIDLARKAGVKVVMVTGDYELTARAIGIRVGLVNNPKIITGRDLNIMSEKELKKALNSDEIIFSRVDPKHKMKIVELFQKLGHIVAVTGDGVNDAPALKKADIGIAMGITGTDVSKESAEMIITDDNFSSIIAAIKEGRVIYDNIKKFILYILSSNATEFFSVIMGYFFGISPILAIQILFVDLGTDVLPSMALAVDKGDPKVMYRPPRNRKQKILSKEMLLYLLQIGVLVGLLAAIVFAIIMLEGGQGFSVKATNYRRATTAVFTILVLCQIVNAFMCRGARGFLESVFGNIRLFFSVIFSFVLLLNVVYNDYFNKIFYTTSLRLSDWVLAVTVSIIFWKFLLRKKKKEAKKFYGFLTSQREFS